MSKFKVGDKVKVIHKAEWGEWGEWGEWIEEMDEMIGNIYKVNDVYEDIGIEIKYGGVYFSFPPSSLELVEDNSMKTFINEDKIPFIELTDSDKLEIINAIKDGNVEYYFEGIWKDKNKLGSFKFYDIYRIKPTKQLVIPWEYINPNYKWAAMDENGKVFVYEQKPYLVVEDGWWRCKLGNYVCLNDLMPLDTNGVDWKESLVKRPD